MEPQVPAAEGGFVRVPRAYITLPVSPGAKVLLLHLCSAANEDGESWYSYADIAILIGRSKASVAAYVRELVEIGLVDAIQQRMANGYNYRRRLKIRGWRDLLAHWRDLTHRKKSRVNKTKHGATEQEKPEYSVSPMSLETPSDPRISACRATAAPAQGLSSEKTERSVQNTECKDPSGPNKNPSNKTQGAVAPVVWSRSDEEEWRRFRPSDNDPIGSTFGTPSPALAEKLERAAAQLRDELGILSPDEARASARHRLTEFARQMQLKVTDEAFEEASRALAEIADTHASQEAALTQLQMLWKPYWRHLPTARQIKLSLTETISQAAPDRDLRARLSRFANRAWIAGLHLARTAQASRGRPRQGA